MWEELQGEGLFDNPHAESLHGGETVPLHALWGKVLRLFIQTHTVAYRQLDLHWLI